MFKELLGQKRTFAEKKILNMDIPKDQPDQLNIEISQGVYANLAILTTATPSTKAIPLLAGKM